jgi:hypothetical protein
MTTRQLPVKLTVNFEANLLSIEQFFFDTGAPGSYDGLLNVLLDTVIPNLERFPEMGRLFLAREARSVESRTTVERLNARVGDGEIREYVIGDFVVHYALIDDGIYLLSIRHQQQLSFDLDTFW